MAKPFGRKKFFWGSFPALDILQLGSNEGEDYAGDLRILFAAPGDLRNVIKTVARLPSTYTQSIEITINGRDFDIVARNIVLLLIALIVEEIEDVCKKVKDRTFGSFIGKTWTFRERSLRVVLEKSPWTRLLSFVDKPPGLTADHAYKIRKAVTLAESREDYYDRYMYCMPPLRRIPFHKFRQDGLLLPFKSPRHEFREPNPADPLHGWPSEEAADVSSGAATADIYGKLFYYLRRLLRSFLDRLWGLDISFKIFQIDASSIPDHFEADTFSRIDVSNISDAGWLGIHQTLFLMVPLLQTPLDNPHATLITSFMNAVDETLTDHDKICDMTPHSRTTKRLVEYLPPKRPTSPYDPELIKFNLGRDLVTTYDHIFNRYSTNFKFCEAADLLGASMNEKHRLKLRPGQSGAQDEFDQCLSGETSGKERYVEWKRIHRSML